MDLYRKKYSKGVNSIYTRRELNSGEQKYSFNTSISTYFKWVEDGFEKIQRNAADGSLYIIDGGYGTTAKEMNTILGILEAMDLLSFEMNGGANSQLYIYVNQVRLLENIINNCEIKPMANQILLHIGETPVDVIKFCQENDIVVEAYSPIAHGRALDDKKIQAMAKKYGVSVPQLCIKYTLQLNTISIPKASSKEHIEDNMKLDFEISEEDMIELMKLNRIDYGVDAFWPVFNKKKQG